MRAGIGSGATLRAESYGSNARGRDAIQPRTTLPAYPLTRLPAYLRRNRNLLLVHRQPLFERL
jgi:hypothetical protein